MPSIAASVGTAAVKIAAASDSGSGPDGWVVTLTSTSAFKIGGSDLDSSNGFPVAANAVLTVEVPSGESLYAIAGSVITVNVLKLKRDIGS